MPRWFELIARKVGSLVRYMMQYRYIRVQGLGFEGSISQGFQG